MEPSGIEEQLFLPKYAEQASKMFFTPTDQIIRSWWAKKQLGKVEAEQWLGSWALETVFLDEFQEIHIYKLWELDQIIYPL